ncbi:protein of unknown function [Streptantibioticus cattleyicolor NRRL 8057 = DSM 46488]|nr:protein of unknown function [Streptantibioticus cattleyicolor NRRL 8057 = DSM 46488]
MRGEVAGDEVVGGEPVHQLGAVDAVAVELLDLGAQPLGDLGGPGPVDAQGVVGPAQRVVLVQVGEEQLAAEAVVVADPVAGDGEAEEPVEEDRILHVAALLVPFGLQFDGLLEGGQVAAQLFEAVHPERRPLLDHEGVERQVAVAVGAVVDQVPQDEGLLGELLVGDEAGGLLGQFEAEGVHRGLGDLAEAGRLPVAEDRAPGETFRHLAYGDGLREEHRGVGVVPAGEVLEGDRHEHRVVVPRALQLRQPLRPHHAQRDGLEVAGRVAVLGVHGEDDQVLQAVPAVGGRLEGEQRVEEVGHPEALGGPAAQVGDERLVVGRVVRQQRGDVPHRRDHPLQLHLDIGAAGRVLGGEVDGTVLRLPRSDHLDGVLQHGPRRVERDSFGAPRRHRQKVFPHDPSSTGDPCVKAPYPRDLPRHKGRLAHLSCPISKRTAIFPVPGGLDGGFFPAPGGLRPLGRAKAAVADGTAYSGGTDPQQDEASEAAACPSSPSATAASWASSRRTPCGPSYGRPAKGSTASNSTSTSARTASWW